MLLSVFKLGYSLKKAVEKVYQYHFQATVKKEKRITFNASFKPALLKRHRNVPELSFGLQNRWPVMTLFCTVFWYALKTVCTKTR